jgi:hypothetical protein
LQGYDRYLRLLELSDELLDDIMPRIRRQLSLQTSHIARQEEAPTRGNIDWQRTLTRTLNETPDLAPLRFDTNVRQQSTDSAENLLAVAILLHYQQTIQDTLREDLQDELLNDQERQILTSYAERVERELAAPYVHVLINEAQHSDIEDLVEQATLRLRAGTGPYRDLLAWWETFSSLHIGRALNSRQLALASRRNDGKVDAWLYEIWIALELLHLLYQEQAISTEDVEVTTDRLQCTFAWAGQRFRFHYNRQPQTTRGQAFGWNNAPGVRPDYMIEHEKPLEVKPQESVIWREPPVILDAKYYLTGTDPMNTHGPIKKMLGDMQLLGARKGILCFPLLADPSRDSQFTREITYNDQAYAAETMRDVSIQAYKFAPDMPPGTLQARLRAILTQAVEWLPEREPVACHGIQLDADSINASRDHVTAGNVLCPKPHIGKGVFDTVNQDTHCLKDPRLCHVFGHAIVPPLVIRAVTLDALKKQTEDIRARSEETLQQAEDAGDEARAEQLCSHIFLGVGRTIEQYVKTRGNTAQLEEQFEEWIFGDYWKRHSWHLALETRNILLSGAYVWDECKQAALDDWAAPAIQYCRALEAELKRRLYNHYPSPGGLRLPRNNPHLTLGAMKFICDNRQTQSDAIHNWRLFTTSVSNSGSDINQFTVNIERLVNENVAMYRNDLAHGERVDQSIARQLRETIIGRRNSPGILCWIAEHLQPVP